jgi:hypothetical protein
MDTVMSDQYLHRILAREAVSASRLSAVFTVQAALTPVLEEWAGVMFRKVQPCGSFAKGTANRGGADIDLLVSLSSSVTETLQLSYEKLFTHLQAQGYSPLDQNLSMSIMFGGFSVDLFLARHKGGIGEDHGLCGHPACSWIETNVAKHVRIVRNSGRMSEIRIIKLWRDQKRIEFPSFYLELVVLQALAGTCGSLSENVWRVFGYLRDTFINERFVDPANGANAISDDLSVVHRARIKIKAMKALSAASWIQIVA